MIDRTKAVRMVLAGSVLILTGSASGWAAEAKAGKATYDKLCVSCHGADGKGNPAMAKTMGEKGLNLTTKDVQSKKDDELLKVITQGEGNEPHARMWRGNPLDVGLPRFWSISLAHRLMGR